MLSARAICPDLQGAFFWSASQTTLPTTGLIAATVDGQITNGWGQWFNTPATAGTYYLWMLAQDANGATSGALDEDLKFYLMARGIPEIEAEGLLVQAFVGEAIEGIEHAGLRDALMDEVVAWLRKRGS